MISLKIGIVGSGFGLYGLLPAFNVISSCHVVSICGIKTDRLLDYCKSIDLTHIYTDWKEMLEKEDLDAIALAVPPVVQYEIATYAIKRGLHVFAEKPLAATYSQAKSLASLAKEYHITSAIDFMFPEIDTWKKTKELIDNKSYGNLKNIIVNWKFLSYDIENNITSWKSDIKEGGGAVSFFFSHTLYYLEHFAGKIADLKSQRILLPGSANDGEVGVKLSMVFESGVTGTANLRSDAKNIKTHQLIFECEKGIIKLENNDGATQNFQLIIIDSNKEHAPLLPKTKNENGNEDERVSEVKKIATRFVEACLEKKQMTPSIIEGLRVQELIEKIRSTSN